MELRTETVINRPPMQAAAVFCLSSSNYGLKITEYGGRLLIKAGASQYTHSGNDDAFT